MAVVVSHAMRRVHQPPADHPYAHLAALRAEDSPWLGAPSDHLGGATPTGALGRSMRYAEPWLCGAPLLLASPGPTLVPLCSCAEASTRSPKHGKGSFCKKCKGQRIVLPVTGSVRSKYGTVRTYPTGSSQSITPLRAGTARLTSPSSRPSILPTSPVDPYDLMRRSRLSCSNEFSSQFRARSTSPSKTRALDNKPYSSTRVKSRTQSPSPPRQAISTRKSILECEINPYELISADHVDKILLDDSKRRRTKPLDKDYEEVDVSIPKKISSQIPKLQTKHRKTSQTKKPSDFSSAQNEAKFKSILKKPSSGFSPEPRREFQNGTISGKKGSHFYLPLPAMSPPRKRVQFLVEHDGGNEYENIVRKEELSSKEKRTSKNEEVQKVQHDERKEEDFMEYEIDEDMDSEPCRLKRSLSERLNQSHLAVSFNDTMALRPPKTRNNLATGGSTLFEAVTDLQRLDGINPSKPRPREPPPLPPPYSGTTIQEPGAREAQQCEQNKGDSKGTSSESPNIGRKKDNLDDAQKDYLNTQEQDDNFNPNKNSNLEPATDKENRTANKKERLNDPNGSKTKISTPELQRARILNEEATYVDELSGKPYDSSRSTESQEMSSKVQSFPNSATNLEKSPVLQHSISKIQSNEQTVTIKSVENVSPKMSNKNECFHKSPTDESYENTAQTQLHKTSSTSQSLEDSTAKRSYKDPANQHHEGFSTTQTYKDYFSTKQVKMSSPLCNHRIPVSEASKSVLESQSALKPLNQTDPQNQTKMKFVREYNTRSISLQETDYTSKYLQESQSRNMSNQEHKVRSRSLQHVDIHNYDFIQHNYQKVDELPETNQALSADFNNKDFTPFCAKQQNEIYETLTVPEVEKPERAGTPPPRCTTEIGTGYEVAVMDDVLNVYEDVPEDQMKREAYVGRDKEELEKKTEVPSPNLQRKENPTNQNGNTTMIQEEQQQNTVIVKQSSFPLQDENNSKYENQHIGTVGQTYQDVPPSAPPRKRGNTKQLSPSPSTKTSLPVRTESSVGKIIGKITPKSTRKSFDEPSSKLEQSDGNYTKLRLKEAEVTQKLERLINDSSTDRNLTSKIIIRSNSQDSTTSSELQRSSELGKIPRSPSLSRSFQKVKMESSKTIVQISTLPIQVIPSSVHRLQIKNEFPDQQNYSKVSIMENPQRKTSIMINGDDCYSTVNVNDDVPIYQSSVVVNDYDSSKIEINSNTRGSSVYITGDFGNSSSPNTNKERPKRTLVILDGTSSASNLSTTALHSQQLGRKSFVAFQEEESYNENQQRDSPRKENIVEETKHERRTCNCSEENKNDIKENKTDAGRNEFGTQQNKFDHQNDYKQNKSNSHANKSDSDQDKSDTAQNKSDSMQNRRNTREDKFDVEENKTDLWKNNINLQKDDLQHIDSCQTKNDSKPSQNEYATENIQHRNVVSKDGPKQNTVIDKDTNNSNGLNKNDDEKSKQGNMQCDVDHLIISKEDNKKNLTPNDKYKSNNLNKLESESFENETTTNDTELKPSSEELQRLLKDPVEAVKRNLIPHVCGKTDVDRRLKSKKNITSPSLVARLLEDPFLGNLTEGLESNTVAKLIQDSLQKLRSQEYQEDDKDSETESYPAYELMEAGSDCYSNHSNRSSVAEDESGTRSKFYQLLADAALQEVEDHHYECIKSNVDPIYEEIEIPPPLPANPPPSSIVDDLQIDKQFTTRSIFEGASKYDILSYLVDAKERGIVPEENYTYNFNNSGEVIVEEEETKETQNVFSSRVSHMSTISDSSEDNSLVITGEKNGHQKSAEVERNDSGVGSETSKSSRSRYLNQPELATCEDCDLPVDSQMEECPLICRKCSKKRSERKEIITEIVETEEKYSRDLQIILEEFYQPMLVAGLLTPDQLSAIFLNVEELLENSQALAERLRDTLEIATEQGDEDLLTVNIGKIFLEAAPMLHAFESYCVRQGPASLLLASLEKEKELLRIFLRVSQMENTVLRRMNLNSFLMVPVQRVTKYPLLLARLHKVTPLHHESRDLLRESQHKIELHLNHMNSETKDVPSRLWRRISSSNGRRSSAEMDLVNIKLRKIAVDVLEWNHDEARFALEGRLLYTQPTDNNWRKGRTIKLTPVNALLVTNGKPNSNNKQDRTPAMEEGVLTFPRHTGVREAALLLVRDKGGRYSLLREPLYLDRCVIATDPAWKSYFEVQELMGKDTFIFKAEDPDMTRTWYCQLQYHAQGMGAWRKRRNALANIMINGMTSRS